MRLYHLLSAKWGLEAVAKKRIKISRFSDLNDPFELLGVNLRNQVHRDAFRKWKSQISKKYGLLCFSRSWQSPVLWSHYGEKHHGLCLGFDIPDEKAIPVRYTDSRIEIDEHNLNESTVIKFLSTKFHEWIYENEVRVITNLSEISSDNKTYYANLSEDLDLKEIIVGALSNISRAQIINEFQQAGLDSSHVELTKARLAFKSYAVVPDKRGLR